MKRILNIVYTVILVVLLSFQLFGQDAFYLDSRLTTGLNNGTSWANAWRSTANINWGSMGANDTLFISGRDAGGSNDSSMYTSGLNVQASGTWGNYFVITAGKYSSSPSGHSGRVIIENSGGQGIEVTSRSWVYVKGLEVRETSANGILIYLTARHIVIDSCEISNAGGFGIYGNGAACQGAGQNMTNWDSTDVIMDITIKNCYIFSFRDEWPNTDDMVQITCGRDIKIHDNFILNNNLQSARGGNEHIHQDDIQTFNIQGLKIYNNVLIIDSAAMGHNLIISAQSRNNTEYSGVDECIIYNNMIYHGGHLVSGGYPATQHLFVRWYGGGAMAPTYIFHNTFVWANGSGPDIEQQRKAVFKNNIFYNNGTYGNDPSIYGGSQLGFWQSGGDYQGAFTTRVDSCQGNLFWYRWTADNEIPFTDYLSNFVGAGGTPSTGAPTGWADWSTTWGGNGVHANPLFTDTLWLDGHHDISSNSPAINAGEQTDWIRAFLLSRSLPITDFYGNSRVGVWDIGAMEYTDGGWVAPDTIPSFSFTAVNNAELNTVYTASSTFTGADSTFTVYTTTGALFNINTNSSHTSTPKTATNGDVIYVQNLTGMSYSTAYTETIIAGGQSRNYVVTTKADPGSPPSTGGIVKGSNGIIWRDSTGKIIKVAQ